MCSHSYTDVYVRVIPKSYQGLHAKTSCISEDEGSPMAFEDYMASKEN
jgi:hypothetical protein